MSQSANPPAAATDPAAAPEAQPRFERFHVGGIECLALSDGGLPRVVPPGSGAATLLPLSCLAVRLPGSGLVLIDTGFGAGTMVRSVGHLPESLAAAGIAPGDVDVVLISHMHPDHIGGMYKPDGSQTYPNATYHVGAEELAYWSQDPLDLSHLTAPPHIRKGMEMAARRMLAAGGDSLRSFRAGEEALPGLGTLPLFGHAPGQVGFIVSSGADRLLFTADAIAFPVVSIETPDVHNPMDMDPDRSVRTRHELIALLSEPGWQAFAPHFPWPSRGRVRREAGKAVWEPAAPAIAA